MIATTKRNRRTAEQVIADLDAKIAAIKTRAERQKVKRDPALKHINAAVRSIDKAVSECDDSATKKALSEARETLSACLSLNGVTIPSHGSAVKASGRRSSGQVDADTLLRHVREHPGSRGEQIAAALGTDSKAVRPVMKRLIEAGNVKTKGERRGMTYSAA